MTTSSDSFTALSTHGCTTAARLHGCTAPWQNGANEKLDEMTISQILAKFQDSTA
jgi:hypothetical protein